MWTVVDNAKHQQPQDRCREASKTMHCQIPIEQRSLFHHREPADFHFQNMDFCALGLRDPDTRLRSLKPTSLTRNLPPDVMRPIFNRCSKYCKNAKHQQQPLEGNTKNHVSATKLAQIYPFPFCQDLAHILLRFLKVKPLDNEVFLL